MRGLHAGTVKLVVRLGSGATRQALLAAGHRQVTLRVEVSAPGGTMYSGSRHISDRR